MDSIDQNQPEENRSNLSGAEAIKKIAELVEDIKTCFFCTVQGTGDSGGARPMTVLKVDEEGSLWFLSATDSHTNEEISSNSFVKLYFQGSTHSDFLLLNGHATIVRTREKIEELWSPFFKTWFTEGIDDPRITAIQFSPNDGYYWDNKHGNTVAAVKMLIGAALGKTLDDSISGRLDVLHISVL